jgi:hypothetical protein
MKSTVAEYTSPFENAQRSSWSKKFPRDKVQVRGAYSYGTKFNGLYQELALFAGGCGKARTGASMY